MEDGEDKTLYIRYCVYHLCEIPEEICPAGQHPAGRWAVVDLQSKLVIATCGRRVEDIDVIGEDRLEISGWSELVEPGWELQAGSSAPAEEPEEISEILPDLLTQWRE